MVFKVPWDLAFCSSSVVVNWLMMVVKRDCWLDSEDLYLLVGLSFLLLLLLFVSEVFGCLWLVVFFGRMIWVGWNDIQRGEWQCRYGRWRDEFGRRRRATNRICLKRIKGFAPEESKGFA